MITTKQDLKKYLKADKLANGRKRVFPMPFDYVWRFLIALRYCEYYQNRKGIFKVFYFFWKWRYIHYSIKCGYDIGLNSCGMGLQLGHRGNIIISKDAHVGDWCRIHVGVNIGATTWIGDRVYIGPGAKFFGAAKVPDDVAVGANSVVNKEFVEKGVTIAGIPAKKVGEKSSAWLLKSNLV